MTRWISLLGFTAVAGIAACGSSTDETNSAVTPWGGTGGGGGTEAGTDAPVVDAPVADVPVVPACPAPAFTDPKLADRTACKFETEAKVADTIGFTAAQRAANPIKHIIVVMKENRSFDEILGQLSKSGQPDAEGPPANWSNPDTAGTAVPWFHATNTCVKPDPAHQWIDMHDQANSGAMDGFVKSADATTSTDGHFAMGYYDATDLPFYYFLANTFAVADHFFPSVLSGTWPNRDFLLCATSGGVKATGQLPFPTVPTVFDSLDAAGVTYGAYTGQTGNIPFAFSLGTWGSHAAQLHPYTQFATDAAAGTLPSVVFVDSQGNTEDEHPPGDLQVGEAWTKTVYDAVVASPLWSSSAIFFTYDEAGGFADHMPPGKSCQGRPEDTDFTELGIRVPMILISPYAKKHFVSHAVHEHTSILRFIELMHDLPSLTARDANSDAMLDMFDFCQDPTTAVPAAPAAGTGKCVP